MQTNLLVNKVKSTQPVFSGINCASTKQHNSFSPQSYNAEIEYFKAVNRSQFNEIKYLTQQVQFASTSREMGQRYLEELETKWNQLELSQNLSNPKILIANFHSVKTIDLDDIINDYIKHSPKDCKEFRTLDKEMVRNIQFVKSSVSQNELKNRVSQLTESENKFGSYGNGHNLNSQYSTVPSLKDHNVDYNTYHIFDLPKSYTSSLTVATPIKFKNSKFFRKYLGNSEIDLRMLFPNEHDDGVFFFNHKLFDLPSSYTSILRPAGPIKTLISNIYPNQVNLPTKRAISTSKDNSKNLTPKLQSNQVF
ncbi:hypothetical protein HK099_001682 [Clydaea vesicula]|uniref:Uncharacterized protein n=1 Tax=Clydaea vesicula TaxID=447962 RepID=A0AAD5Y3V7_9FUNG|nr:hypothetical protein HK099_001682 [Clydaea vesicula]